MSMRNLTSSLLSDLLDLVRFGVTSTTILLTVTDFSEKYKMKTLCFLMGNFGLTKPLMLHLIFTELSCQ